MKPNAKREQNRAIDESGNRGTRGFQTSLLPWIVSARTWPRVNCRV
jgi:hypothetical protein